MTDHGIVISELSPTINRSVLGRPSPRASSALRPSMLASMRAPRFVTLDRESRIECSTSDPVTRTSGAIDVYGPMYASVTRLPAPITAGAPAREGSHRGPLPANNPP